MEFFNFCLVLKCITKTEDRGNLLAKLAADGFITRITTSNGFSNNYRMQGSVLSWFQQKIHIGSYLHTSDARTKDAYTTDTQGGFHFLHHWPTSAVINISNKILDSDTAFFLIHGKLNYYEVQVLLLGSWKRQSAGHYNHYRDDYIVVDMEFVQRAFKNMYKVRFLSLRGTSGIVHFPDSVSHLSQLDFLDLRACNNLESLPKGIGSLTKVEYLDLSKCYLLEHIPNKITFLSNLRVLKGFIINSDPHVLRSSTRRKWSKKVAAPTSASSSCSVSEVSHLTKLEKLIICTQRMSFPTKEDLQTLCNLPHLHTLGITWAGSPNTAQIDGNFQEFPNIVEKLELQSAPPQTASQLLELIGKQQEDSCLNKLYIRGGWLQEFSPDKHCFPNVKIVRFRYLPNLKVKWDQFKLSFPSLTRLEVSQCPKFASFPCDDNGIW